MLWSCVFLIVMSFSRQCAVILGCVYAGLLMLSERPSFGRSRGVQERFARPHVSGLIRLVGLWWESFGPGRGIKERRSTHGLAAVGFASFASCRSGARIAAGGRRARLVGVDCRNPISRAISSRIHSKESLLTLPKCRCRRRQLLAGDMRTRA